MYLSGVVFICVCFFSHSLSKNEFCKPNSLRFCFIFKNGWYAAQDQIMLRLFKTFQWIEWEKKIVKYTPNTNRRTATTPLNNKSISKAFLSMWCFLCVCLRKLQEGQDHRNDSNEPFRSNNVIGFCGRNWNATNLMAKFQIAIKNWSQINAFVNYSMRLFRRTFSESYVFLLSIVKCQQLISWFLFWKLNFGYLVFILNISDLWLEERGQNMRTP